MKRTKHISLAIALALTTLSCENDTQEIAAPEPQKSEFLLKSMVWKDLEASAFLTYDNDNNIKNIEYVGPRRSYNESFIYQQKKIKEISTGPGNYRNIFAYDINGRIQTMTKYIIEDVDRPTLQLEFTYDQYNNVSVLKYLDINEAGSKLISTHTYEFDQEGHPSKITTVDNNGNKSITTIVGYSPDISFDPLYFVGINIGEFYAFYNYPILSSLRQLPTDITVSSVVAGQTKVVREVHFTYSLTGRRLDKQVSRQHYPMNPQYDQQVEVEFKY